MRFSFDHSGLHAFEGTVVVENLLHLHLLVESALFGKVADTVVGGTSRCLAENLDAAGIRMEYVENHSNGRGLA